MSTDKSVFDCPKTDPPPPTGETVMDPKPTIEVENLRPSPSLQTYRETTMNEAIRYTEDDLDQIRRTLKTFRCRQTRMLGRRDSDPDPYSPGYIFYCLH